MTDQVIKKWKQRLHNMKKEDYIVLLLIGVLLLIISLPTEKEKAAKNNTAKNNAEGQQKGGGQERGDIEDFLGETGAKEKAETKKTALEEGDFNNNSSYDLDVYVTNLEKRVEKIVSGMEGVGEVRVMITVSDAGTEILECNREITTSNLEETDNAGGSRKNTENGQREEVVYRKDADGNEIPYVVRRKLPEVTGVVVTAQGAGNAKVKENIIGAVGVLFNLNEHRIKVIRMKS